MDTISLKDAVQGAAMRVEQMWTVARYPSGEWTTGGRPDDPAYEGCELFRVMAKDRNHAKKKAQAQRRKASKAQKG